MNYRRYDIEVDSLFSLSWVNGKLMDVLGGNVEYSLDGMKKDPDIPKRWAYPFDSVITQGNYQICYENSGTKALLIKDDELVRELNRPFYYAKDYGYPISFLTLPGGKTGIIHCPGEYNVIDIEGAETGDILTKRPIEAKDIFHSRFQISQDGKWLVSNGWVWQPWNIACLYDLSLALDDPKHLDGYGIDTALTSTGEWEVDNVVFGENNLIACLNKDEDGLLLGNLSLKDFELTTVPITQPTGSIMPLGSNYIVAFDKHPKILDINSGEVVEELVDIESPHECTQPHVSFYKYPPPKIAMDPSGKQFAIGYEKKIVVIQFQ